MMPLMGCFQIASAIYKIANNLICLVSNIVIISHLKQFIRRPLIIIHAGLASFMNDQSNWSPNRLNNEELLKEIRPAHHQEPNTTLSTFYFKHATVNAADVGVSPYLSPCVSV